MITASSLTRLRQCPSSAVLPRAENASIWADAGNEEHDRLAHWVVDRDSDAISDIVDADLLARLPSLVPPGARAELKLAYDVVARTARIIGEGSGRAYGDPGPFEIVGSTDVGGEDGDTIVVIDWKTGFADVEPAATNDQLWFYATALCRALGKDRAIIRIVYTKTGRVDSYEIEWDELPSFADKLERLHVQVAARIATKSRGEILETREGSWCKHCASKPYCGSKTALLVQVAEHGLAVIGDTTMTPDRAAAAYQQIEKVEQLVKDARKRLEAYVDEQGPIDLGGGKMYGRYHRKGNESLDGELAVQAIREVVGEQAKEFEAIAIERKVVATKAAIKRAAQQLVAIGALKVEKAVLARLKELGGVKSTPTIPLGEFVRAKNDPATLPEIDADNLNRLLEKAG